MVIEQISFLMFARLLDIREIRDEKESKRTKKFLEQHKKKKYLKGLKYYGQSILYQKTYDLWKENNIHEPPCFIIDDGRDDPLNLIVEIKGYRREDAKEKKSTMEAYWIPGVNNHGHYGRWAFAEFTEVYQIESDFKAKVKEEFNKMIDQVLIMGKV